MKLIALALTLCISANVFAATADSMQSLERSLDNYQYAMTVDWDQKDNSFYTQKTEAFFAELGTLMQNGSVTQADVMTLLEKKVADKKVVADMKARLNGVQASTPSELAKVLSQNSDKFYSRGASWEGEAITIGIGVLVVGVIAYAIYFSATHKCVAYATAYTCNNSSGYYSGTYGGYYTGGYTYCGYQDVCTDYEKK